MQSPRHNRMVAEFLVITVGDEAVPAQVHLVGIKRSPRGLGLGKELISLRYSVKGLRQGFVEALHKILEHHHEECRYGYRLHP